MTDGELLRRYANERSETAFEELVRRRINLVYSAALRQVNNDAHLAGDVTQTVFTDLARKARTLAHHVSLTAWLYTSARFAAANVRRSERRRAMREEKAHAMDAIYSTQEPEADWTQIGTILDDAMETLNADDRECVLLRHFERCSYAEIGARLRLSEDGARMRVNRALDKLHDGLAKRGITSTALALAAVLTQEAVAAAPAHLAARVASAAIAETAKTGALAFLLISKLKLALAGLVLAAAVVTVLNLRHSRAETSRKFSQAVAQTNFVPPVAPVMPRMEAAPMGNDDKSLRLHLQIVTADSGQPIPFAQIQYFNWDNDPWNRMKQTHLVSDRFGVCDISYPSNFTRLELIIGKEPFADTRLLWQRPLGDVVPSNYVLRVERAVPIGGIVVDADGNGVGAATVDWKLSAPSISESKPPPEHEYYGTKYEVVTDSAGHWQISRISSAILPYLVGQAVESNYVDSQIVFTGRDTFARARLEKGDHVFQLESGRIVEGDVTDVNGNPIPNAEISVNNRNGKSDKNGKFSVRGCASEREHITAKAPGFPATTAEIDLDEIKFPVRLVMRPAKVLRVRFLDSDGTPVRYAVLFPRSFLDGWRNASSDIDGRIIWTNAPDDDLEFHALAPGFPDAPNVTIHPDGEEHVITLSRNTTIKK